MIEREELVNKLEARANSLGQKIQDLRDAANRALYPGKPDQWLYSSWLTEKAEHLQEERVHVLRELANARDLGEVKRI